MEYPDEIEEISNTPLQHQRAFGTGLKRKRINFVPEASAATLSEPKRPSKSASDLYLSIVLPHDGTADSTSSAKCLPQRSLPERTVDSPIESEGGDCIDRQEQEICPVCHNLVGKKDSGMPHEASLSHQLALQHSFPPSALDRSRIGLKHLESHGWDPDSRHGLGALGEGRLYPIVAKPRDDNRGIGAKKEDKPTLAPKPRTLDAGAMKAKDKKDKISNQKLHDLFYGRDDVNEYLGLDH